MKRFRLTLLTLFVLLVGGCASEVSTAPPPSSVPAPVMIPSTPPTTAPAPTSTPTVSPTPTPTISSTPSPAITQTAAPSPSPAPTAAAPKWREVSAPAGVKVTDAQWIEVDAPQGRKILAVVFRPQGTPPFPLVVILHGTEGFRMTHVELAQYFAKNGFIAVAGDWFGGHWSMAGGGRSPTPVPFTYPDGIDWPNGPDMPVLGVMSGDSILANTALPLINASRALPGARAERTGVWGHSRGAMVALFTAATDMRAVVSAAGALPASVATRMKAPILLLQGTADTLVGVQEARDFESALRAAGKTVEAEYYDKAPHGIPWTPPWQDDVRQRSVAFFKKYLGP